MMRRLVVRFVAGFVATGVLGVAVACTGDDPDIGAASSSGGSSGAASSTSGGGGSSGTNSSSGSSPDACTPGTSTCSGTLLSTCKPDGTGTTDATCELGCADAPTPHCKAPAPSANGATAADLEGAGLQDITLDTTTLDSDTGAITGLRAANTMPASGMREVIAGTAFRVADIPGGGGRKIGIFTFGKLTVGNQKTVTIVGTNAVALISSQDIAVLGTIDARGTCVGNAAGPGGGKGGTVGAAGVAAQGAGAGATGKSNTGGANSGGGGAGYGDNGGDTFQLGVLKKTVGGLPYGGLELVPIAGGSGGGGGGEPTLASANAGVGGGGGGAIHLFAKNQIVIGGGAAKGGVNAGGCGGKGAVIPVNANASACGGGGGSGGAILIEAKTVKLDANGFIVANGGGGGGGAASAGPAVNGGNGSNGALTINQTVNSGGSSVGTCGAGGYGGATNDTSTAVDSTNRGGDGVTGGSGNCTGGGGGGVGRIRINSLAKAIVVVDPATPRISPALDEKNSHLDATATQGVLRAE